MNTSAGLILDTCTYSSGDESQTLTETEVKLKQDFEDFRDMLPPPIPLLPKSLRPSDPIFQSQNIPFELLFDIPLSERPEPLGPKVSPQSFPSRYDPNTTFKSFFSKDLLVFQRSSSLTKHEFNSNLCDLKKLLSKRRQREKKSEKSPENLLLCKELTRFYTPSEGDKTLVFESRFECGNLAMAGKLNDNEYNLLLQNDINSKGHTQWFYFSVENTTEGLRVKFNILNFAKSDSLYNEGMKVMIYSEKESNLIGTPWFRGGDDLMYYPNGIVKEGSTSMKSYYSLTFTYQFRYSSDRVFFAYSLPYSFSALQSLLDSYESDKERSQYFLRKTLCKSIGGNNCDYLTITNKGTLEEIKGKRAVIISARVHPGETVGSWMMLGVLDFLTGSSQEANELRQKYIFKVLPMLNPDGVINGNYRCSLVGADLNRRWKTPQVDLHPTIYNFKKMIRNTAETYEIDLICDLHGHSRKNNIFMYGCNYQRSPQACKLFPYILSKISPSFSFEDSRFGVQRSKESTMRVALFKELKIPNIFTLEASFCGADKGKYNNLHFTAEILEEMGRDLCKALLILSQNSALARSPLLKKQPNKNSDAYIDTEAFITKEHNVETILQELLTKKEAISSAQSSSSGSESEPSEDNLDFDQLKNILPSNRRNSVGTRKKLDASKLNIGKNRSCGKKCARCGEEEKSKHNCRMSLSVPVGKKLVVGLRTYYNLAGKKVHDQATQTPQSFYEKSPKKRFLSSLGPLSYEAEGIEDGFFSSSQNRLTKNLPILRLYKKDYKTND